MNYACVYNITGIEYIHYILAWCGPLQSMACTIPHQEEYTRLGEVIRAPQAPQATDFVKSYQTRFCPRVGTNLPKFSQVTSSLMASTHQDSLNRALPFLLWK